MLRRIKHTERFYNALDTEDLEFGMKRIMCLRIHMDCFWCKIVQGDLVLKEAEAAKWLIKEELDSVQWLPADITLIDIIKQSL